MVLFLDGVGRIGGCACAYRVGLGVVVRTSDEIISIWLWGCYGFSLDILLWCDGFVSAVM